MTSRAALDAICLAVSEKHGIPYGQIMGRRRAYKIVAARHEAMMRMLEVATQNDVARYFGRHHTTVMHAQDKMEKANGTRHR